MADIPLEMLPTLFALDPRTGDLFWKERDLSLFQDERAGKIWNTKWAGKKVAAHDAGQGYLKVRVFNRSRLAHRIIFALHHGYYPPAVDHINGNRADNRIVNLRAADNLINSRNRRLSPRNTSGANGVSWDKRYKSWSAYVCSGRRVKLLGRFTDYDVAAAVANAARTALGFHPNHGRRA